MESTAWQAATESGIEQFLNEEIPEWRELTMDEIRAKLFGKIDETLDAYNLLMGR